ncbi:interleukin-20 receptor subunit alpha-like [Seriola lalandi dorsalis]|uniref:Interleukin-20 receptor subunit alpha-like n=1 Tax=Seriola lalandi dorsalis TaxID=1841481 RepID=A0A3B4YS76_SERLL|nr:interleukin-20 receptor subunit alpha-like [Seriola lalandi dorsalis]XP_056261438.1 interleukin-20 receptor subunit alpha [Seriola aureovittata]
MWIVFIFLNLGVLHRTVSSSPPSPINVNFSSVNLMNVVQWSPGNGTPVDTHFTVQYAIYGHSVKGSKGKRVHWRAVHQCTDIVRRWCDLSSETWDQEQGYYARVRAVGRKGSSKWTLTERRFDPKTDTSFGPPLVTVEVEDNNAIITLKGPVRYQPNNHTPVIPMATLYPQMTYSLFIHNSHRDQTHHFPVVSSPYKYQRMAHETEYCFRAKASLVSMPILCQSSAWHCITTPKDPVTEQLQRAVWGIVVPSLCICVLVVVGYFLRNYLMGKGQESPHTLKQPSFHLTPLTFPPEKLNLILISVIENKPPSGIGTAISDPACPKKHITCPPPRYSPQRPETPTEPDDLSVDYGLVGIAPKINDGGEDWNNLNGKGQKCKAENSYEKKELIVEVGHPAGVDSPDARSYLSQKSTHTRMQTHMPIHSQAHAQTEVSTLVQAQAWASVLVNQIKGSLLSYQGATKGEVSREEDRECPGLFLTKKPQTDICVPLTNLQTNEKVGMGERDGKIDGIEEEGSESEKVALMSAYASQNINNIPNSHKDQSVLLPNDYGVVLNLATANGIEDDEDEDNGSICINWDPETKKLLLPEMAMKFNKEGAMGGLKQGQEGSKYKMAGEEEKVNALKSELKLENVFVRQGSEEEEARHLERWRREKQGRRRMIL